ncbi:MAG: Tol-Pal system beta propeller repeat protein TolB [Terriglobales bacterium]
MSSHPCLRRGLCLRPSLHPVLAALATLALVLGSAAAPPQQVTIAITGAKKLRLAQPDFRLLSPATGANPALQQTFDSVLWNDLYQSGLVSMVSRSFYPLQQPSTPTDLPAPQLAVWGQQPTTAQRLVFGNIQVANHLLRIDGYLYNITASAQPFMIGKRYTDQATPAAAREIAHEFADAIIQALGGGPGIAQSKIAFISNRTGHKEVWMMDYDGYGQHQITHLGSIAYSPRLSPDGTKLAFMSFASGRPEIKIYSLLTHRYPYFPHYGGTNATPAWSPDGSLLAFSSSMHGGYMEIYTIRANGTHLRQLTFSHSVNIAPVWNPKTGAQLAFESDRTGLPQIYTMDADGTNQRDITPSGYAVSPSWSPNGEALAFSWRRNGGGENNTGGYDIYIFNLADGSYTQLTHNGQRNDFPSWAPDGRHVVFATGGGRHWQLFTVLADGSDPTQLTFAGSNSMPNWSWH